VASAQRAGHLNHDDEGTSAAQVQRQMTPDEVMEMATVRFTHF